MKEQILVSIDSRLAEELEKVAPRKERKRSEFVRMAIWKAIWAEMERKTAEAYRRIPDTAEDAYFDARVWEQAPRRPRRQRARRLAQR